MSIEQLYQLYLQANGVTTDTRNITAGSIFFALKGEKFNANLFAAEALEKGAAYAVVEEVADASWGDLYGNGLIKVENVLSTLQALAGYHRKQFKAPVIGITGSNGKTTTKELVAAVLAAKYKTYATKGNLNNHIGIPLTLLAINKDDIEMAVIEMGANHQGEIASYCAYVQADYGLITNIGSAHLEGFGGFEGVIKGKTELYTDLLARNGGIFACADNQLLLDNIQQKSSLYPQWNRALKLITYGKQADAYCKGSMASSGEFLSVEVEGTIIQTNLVGEYNFDNVMAAICIGKYFNVPMRSIKEAIESYLPSNNRSQKVAYGNSTIILDAYNANPSSMGEALRNFDKQPGNNKIVILGEMMELGEYSRTEHDKIKVQVEQMALNGKVFTGNGFAFLANHPGVQWFATTTELKEWFKAQQFNEALILIKGSRKNELEKLLQ